MKRNFMIFFGIGFVKISSYFEFKKQKKGLVGFLCCLIFRKIITFEKK